MVLFVFKHSVMPVIQVKVMSHGIEMANKTLSISNKFNWTLKKIGNARISKKVTVLQLHSSIIREQLKMADKIECLLIILTWVFVIVFQLMVHAGVEMFVMNKWLKTSIMVLSVNSKNILISVILKIGMHKYMLINLSCLCQIMKEVNGSNLILIIKNLIHGQESEFSSMSIDFQFIH